MLNSNHSLSTNQWLSTTSVLPQAVSTLPLCSWHQSPYSCSNITFRVWPTFWVYGHFSTDFIFTTSSSAFLQNWVFSFSTTFPRASTLLLLPDEFSQVYQNLFSPLSSSYTAILPHFPGLPSHWAVTLQDSKSDNTLPRSRSATYLKGSSKHLDLHPPAHPEISLFQLSYPQLR